jgi:predicted nucleotidyltransferase component of viral defense system
MLPRFESGEVPRLSFRFVSESGLKRRLKIEINTHEHLAGVVDKTFAVDHRAARGSVEIPTHSLNELLATKLRAFCQRDKGRDLFGLWWSHKRDEIDPGEIVRLFLDSMSHGGEEADSAPELRAKLVARHARGIFEEVRPLRRTSVEYDTDEALDVVRGRVRRASTERRRCQGTAGLPPGRTAGLHLRGHVISTPTDG